MKPKIKICGITRLADAQMSVDLGADYLGFNFYQGSVRYMDPEKAGEIIREIQGKTVSVGLFVNSALADIEKVLEICPLDMIQLHGDESPGDCQAISRLGLDVIKAIRVDRRETLGRIGQYETGYILLDAFCEGSYGGTGHFFDWSCLGDAQGNWADKKLFLAGGIGPDTIRAAMKMGTYAVDLCSGVESGPGIKDGEKLKRLFEKIREIS